jgi:hypothetical protein
MPIDLTNIKGPGKGETALSLIGTLASLAGRVLTGNENIDFGAPFNAGSQYLAHKRLSEGLVNLLGSTPHTKPIVDMGTAIDQANNPPPTQGPTLGNYGGNLQVPAVPAPITPINGPIGGPQPNQQPSLLSTIQGLQTTPQTTSSDTPTNIYSDPRLLAGLSILDPKVGEAALVGQIKNESNPMKDIMSYLALRDYQTPEEKTTARQNEFNYQEGVKKQNALDVKNLEQKQKDAIVNYQKAGLMNDLDSLEQTIKGIPSGPVVGRIQNVLAQGGKGTNPEAVTRFHSLVTGIKLQYGKDFSGRYNNAEGAEIEKKLLPVLNLPPKQQAAALDAARTLIKNKFNSGEYLSEGANTSNVDSRDQQTDIWAKQNPTDPVAQEWIKKRGL